MLAHLALSKVVVAAYKHTVKSEWHIPSMAMNYLPIRQL
jgi:hypothetical protein